MTPSSQAICNRFLRRLSSKLDIIIISLPAIVSLDVLHSNTTSSFNTDKTPKKYFTETGSKSFNQFKVFYKF